MSPFIPDKQIPFWRPAQPEEAILNQISHALEAEYLNEGDVCEQVEEALAAHHGFKYAMLTTSCTVALFLALKVSGITNHSVVAVPDLTFTATANAVKLAGGSVKLIGVDPDTRLMDMRCLEQAIKGRVDAVILVHVSGAKSVIPPTLLDQIKARGIRVIEDAAEAFGNTTLGSQSRISCMSFSPNKLVSAGQGGLFLTNNDGLIRDARALKDHGRAKRGTGGDDIHEKLGFNFKYTDLQASVLLPQIPLIRDRRAQCVQRHAQYMLGLEDLHDVHVYPFGDHDLPLWTDIRLPTVHHRDALAKYLQERGIGTRKYWIPLHRHQAYSQKSTKWLSGTEQETSERSLWLPSAYTLTTADVDKVVTTIYQWHGSKS